MNEQIIIGADFVPTPSNEELFVNGELEKLFGHELLEIINNAKHRIFNLEVPLTDKKTPIDKCGPNLIAPTSTIAAYKKTHVDLLTLANNHILDQDEQGLRSTIELLNNNCISHVGVGCGIKEAAKPYVFYLNDKKIGIYACAEHEFSIVDEKNGVQIRLIH